MSAPDGQTRKKYELIINKKPFEWPNQLISGADILKLAGSPTDWIVNEIIDGPGDDPEVGPSQEVDLDPKAEPKGTKRFTTRKPKTNPG